MRRNIISDTQSITPELFSELLGVKSKDLPESCVNFIGQNNFSYTNVTENDKENLYLEVLKKINSNKFTISNEKRVGQWNDGWQQNLNDLIASGNLGALDPYLQRTQWS